MTMRDSIGLFAVAVGLGATLLMDAWNLLLKSAWGIPSLNLCHLGRWLLHMTAGRFTHASIGASPARRFECAAGYAAHYSIGIAFALVFVIVARGWHERPTLLPALLYGIGTVAIPFFVMQPALGLGIASARAKDPRQARLKSLATHTVFGAGLYLGAVVWNLAFAG